MPDRLLSFALISMVASTLLNVALGEEIDFNRDIRPVLSDHCFQCHGPDASHREADLRLDVENAAKDWVIEPGSLDSELISRITSADPDEEMPPGEGGKPLEPQEIELLKRWVAAGAKWSEHWAYVTPREHPIPKSDSEWPHNWIDHFILDRLEREGLSRSPDADKVTLVRRLYFDLVGLPPSPERVEAFVQNTSPGAYEALVDELLSSSHFGERMAMYWLDLVRYADTVGYHGDQDQNISPYRDYVIDAFNRNLPFDQFTCEQLAGDLLPEPTIDQQIATGYNRLLQTSHEGGVQPKEYLTIYQADRVRNISAVWLGGTLGCAQCHDHKYDPYTSKDFYAMAAFFADIDEEKHFKVGSNALPTARPPEIDVLSRTDRDQLAAIRARMEELEEASDRTEFAALRRQEKKIERRRRRTMVTVALEQPRTVRLLPRGNWLDDSGPIMEPAVPEFLGSLPEASTATRLDLARWLTDERDGVGLLTARVMANRFWYLILGAGLSPSLDDFGGQGKPPTYAELLDNLAVEFVSSGWNMKHLLKLMVMSRTYQQTSVTSDELRERDPLNLLFARQSRYRLPAETVRDVALSVSGLLVDELGGASVKPYQPAGYYRHLNFPPRRYAHHADGRQWRRGVYVHWQRQFLHPMLKAFDAPSREECTAGRPRSNTPLAALVLLNDPTFVEAARCLAERVLLTAGDDQDRIIDAFRLVTSREPDDVERETLLRLLEVSFGDQDEDEGMPAILEIGEKSPNEQLQSEEVAAWTTVCRAILNLSEATTRQ